MRWLDELRLAVMFLTRLPCGSFNGAAPPLSAALWAFPLVGLITGAIGWGVHLLLTCLGATPLLASSVALGATTLATGALHHDGLADFADGIGGGRDRAHVLEIMRDSRIGSYGVLALLFAVALQISALASFSGSIPLTAFLLIGAGSRLSMLGLLTLMPPARAEGLGQNARGGQNLKTALPGAILTVLLALFLCLAGLAALAAMTLGAALIARLAHRRLGGQTGDVLGAAQMVAATLGWIALSLTLP
ncbi:adenosylcobinamide-GDP ribazoletransferase [Paracoccaceae bacterium GXU_MW_L88]